MDYELEIVCEGQDTIKFCKEDSGNIEGVNFKINTVEENVNDRSSNVINQIVVNGSIVLENTARCKKLIEWSCSNDRSSVYRTVNITIKITNETVRKYEIENVFCEDYTEDFRDNVGTFELKMAQRKGCLDSIYPS